MADDIVTRLRGQRTNGVLCDQAADGIERLRTERDHWRERCENAEECLQFINRRKKWWQL